MKSARIKSAIEHGKRTQLTCESKGVSLGIFEHKVKNGNLVVYTEAGVLGNPKSMNYKVILSFKPANSIINFSLLRTQILVPQSTKNQLMSMK